MEAHAMLWRRLDGPGHDACILEIGETGARLRGSAVFLHDGAPAQLHYEVHCDREWRCQRGAVSGWIGSAAMNYSFVRDGGWRMNGLLVPGLEHCVDLDFGITPATNVFPLRRLALKPGEGADAPAAWFDVGGFELVALPQRYERRSESIWWYESPTAGYAAELEVAASGFTQHYPDLWIAER